jgi:hypothetical protein
MITKPEVIVASEVDEQATIALNRCPALMQCHVLRAFAIGMLQLD